MTNSNSIQIFESPYNVDIPVSDIPTFVFSQQPAEAKSHPQYFDADGPSTNNFSLAQAELWVRRLAKGLQNCGFVPDTKILLFSENSVYFPVLFWGVLASGCVFTGCSPNSSHEKLCYQLRDSDSRLLLADPPRLEKALRAADQVGLNRDSVLVFTHLKDDRGFPVRPWTDMWAAAYEVNSSWDWRRLTTREEAQSTTAIIDYSSSGTETSGLPKGVEISHYNMIAASVQFAFKHRMAMAAGTARAKKRKERIDLSGNERWLTLLPMFHAYGQAHYCTTAAIMGCNVYIMPTNITTTTSSGNQSNLADKCLLYMDVYRITFFAVAAADPNLLLRCIFSKHLATASSNLDNLRSIESVLLLSTRGAPLEEDPEIAQRLLPGVRVRQSWGLVETTGSVIAQDNDEGGGGAPSSSAVGWLDPNMMVKIVPPLGPREMEGENEAKEPYAAMVGEIWVAGPNVMKGYYKRRPEETSGCSIVVVEEEGKYRWLRTGHVGYVEERTGRLHVIIDRFKLGIRPAL